MLDVLSPTNNDSYPILQEEVEAATKSPKKGKTAGVDSIPSELAQAGGEAMIDMLIIICNKIWQTEDKKLETVCSCKYLGATVSDGGSKPEVLPRIAQTTAAVTKVKVIWNNKNITISSKIRLMRSLAMSIRLYACETRTLKADIERRIQALEM